MKHTFVVEGRIDIKGTGTATHPDTCTCGRLAANGKDGESTEYGQVYPRTPGTPVNAATVVSLHHCGRPGGAQVRFLVSSLRPVAPYEDEQIMASGAQAPVKVKLTVGQFIWARLFIPNVNFENMISISSSLDHGHDPCSP